MNVFVPLLVSLVPAAAPQQGFRLDAKAREAVIDGIVKALDERYVFPRVAEDMEFALREHLKDKHYDEIDDPQRFAVILTDHLQEVSSDRHLRVRFSSEALPADNGHDGPGPGDLEALQRDGARDNFGFERVERLPGNIGYLDLRGFQPPEFAGPTALAAMAFLANSDAVIVDLRQNGGGTPEMVRLLCSYFFGPEPVHLNDLYYRPGDRTEEFWTLADLPGKRLVDQPLYVLTSESTFSAAEEFAYDLKCLKRATIVGAKTGGGAHPGGMQRVHDHFAVFVPDGRAINPITKTDWEGTGVEPDVACEAQSALERARVLALERLIADEKDVRRKGELQQALGLARVALDQKVARRSETAR